MNVIRRTPQMTREAFFDWAEVQRERYEFDGFAPVLMTGGNRNHSRICRNIHLALWPRLKGSPCEPLGPDAGLATIGDAVRYPDALVACSQSPGTDRVIPGVVIVFEVLSPTSGHVDRIVKTREYRAVPSIRRYVILEHGSRALTVYARAKSEDPWTTDILTAEETLKLPELGIAIPIGEFYQGTDIPDAIDDSPPAEKS